MKMAYVELCAGKGKYNYFIFCDIGSEPSMLELDKAIDIEVGDRLFADIEAGTLRHESPRGKLKTAAKILS